MIETTPLLSKFIFETHYVYASLLLYAFSILFYYVFCIKDMCSCRSRSPSPALKSSTPTNCPIIQGDVNNNTSILHKTFTLSTLFVANLAKQTNIKGLLEPVHTKISFECRYYPVRQLVLDKCKHSNPVAMSHAPSLGRNSLGLCAKLNNYKQKS